MADSKENRETSTVTEGVKTGVFPSEAKFTSGDKVQVEKDGNWFNATVNAVTLSGIPDADGQLVKYTVTRDAVNGTFNHTPEQYVPQSRVRAVPEVETPVEEDAKPSKRAARRAAAKKLDGTIEEKSETEDSTEEAVVSDPLTDEGAAESVTTEDSVETAPEEPVVPVEPTEPESDKPAEVK